jgi:homoserine O-acetyltransferase/O-succinyltransferase
MGAMAALQFAATFPSRAQRVAMVCGTARVPAYNRVFLASLRAAICADAAWSPAEQRFVARPAAGLNAFGAIYAGWGLRFKSLPDPSPHPPTPFRRRLPQPARGP